MVFFCTVILYHVSPQMAIKRLENYHFQKLFTPHGKCAKEVVGCIPTVLFRVPTDHSDFITETFAF